VPDNLLVIGGTGFIGRSLSLEALRVGYKVVVLSLNTPSLEKIIKNIEYLQVDIVCLDELKEKLANYDFDYIVNLSGYVDHSNFSDGGKRALDVHFGGVQNILQSVNLKSLKRFVQIGSSDEYGGTLAPQYEYMRESPISPYSLGKTASTQLLQMLYRAEGIPTVILRLFLVYGPGQENNRFIPQVINGCLSSANFPTSSGNQLRDFCYVDDITNGILMALKNDKVNGKVINLASGKPVRIREVVELVQNKIGYGKADFGKIPYRTGENMELYADISKANEILKWEPFTSIEEGIKRTIEYYQRKK
jgi:nucleoside-diphosphate-sugar epimerase